METTFYGLCPSKTWTIMALHNFLFLTLVIFRNFVAVLVDADVFTDTTFWSSTHVSSTTGIFSDYCKILSLWCLFLYVPAESVRRYLVQGLNTWPLDGSSTCIINSYIPYTTFASDINGAWFGNFYIHFQMIFDIWLR